MPSRTPTHRRDIDGLRAVAVLPVILFHAGLPAFSGGYLGVDVFFVISGFLITGILARDLGEGRFSLARFYERRARRILPALAFVLVACIPVAVAWLTPNELKSFAQSLAATALSVSNFLFWQWLDYFGPDADRLPLLHTWSLGIEEQFYILFPPLLALLWLRRRRTATLALLLVLSLAGAAWATRHAPSAGFFLLPFRAWELLLGGLLALAAPRPRALATPGLALVLAAMAAVPLGVTGILPTILACAGAGLVLAFPGGPASRLLALPLPVGIGLVSYSAYLWHQPLLVFARVRFGHLEPPAAVALGSLALLLAWPTWRYVETPFRRPAGTSPRPALLAAAATIALLTALGAAGALTDGLAFRTSAPIREIMASVTDTNPWRPTCKTELNAKNPTHPVAGCLLDGARPGVAFWGDSHADALQGAVFEAAKGAGFRFYSVTRSACPPVPGLIRTGPAASTDCDAFVRGVEDYVARDGTRVAVVAARWMSGVSPRGFDNGEGGVEGDPGDVLTPMGATPASDAERQAEVVAAYVRAVQDLLDRGLRVVLVYPVPEAGWNVPEELARRRAASAEPVTLSTDYQAYLRRQAPVLAAFDAIESPNLTRVRPADILCNSELPGRCLNSLGDRPLYFDDDHLNMTGARLVAPAILAAVEAARRAAAGQPAPAAVPAAAHTTD